MRLPFELDPQIIHHTIHSQAGSLGKAVIELLVNAVGAQASEVLLRLTCEGFECKDNGNGFASREDVVRYFGRFGLPHKESDATYWLFRLGRCQIMAHDSTIWRSKACMMTVNMEAQERLRIATVLLVPPETIMDVPLYWMMGEDDVSIRQYWVDKPWEHVQMPQYSDDVAALVKPGETTWLLERNTAAPGFIRVEDYLTWRKVQGDLC